MIGAPLARPGDIVVYRLPHSGMLRLGQVREERDCADWRRRGGSLLVRAVATLMGGVLEALPAGAVVYHAVTPQDCVVVEVPDVEGLKPEVRK